MTDKRQPLVIADLGDNQKIYIPVEFCALDGIPLYLKNDSFRMKDILATARKNPGQKFGEINDFTEKLFKQEALSNWGISI